MSKANMIICWNEIENCRLHHCKVHSWLIQLRCKLKKQRTKNRNILIIIIIAVPWQFIFDQLESVSLYRALFYYHRCYYYDCHGLPESMPVVFVIDLIIILLLSIFRIFKTNSNLMCEQEKNTPQALTEITDFWLEPKISADRSIRRIC